MTVVPDDVRRSVESQGAAGRSRLAALPGIVGELCHAWSLSEGEVLGGGKWSYVARVRGADGTEAAVLKVAFPTPEFSRRLATIEAAAGRGYVRLYDADPARHALLLEPLGPPLAFSGHAVEQQLDVLAATLRQAWRAPRPSRAATAVEPGSDKASGLLALIEESWPRDREPCSPRVVARARALAEQRAAAFDLNACVLCHGDPHVGNALAVRSPRPGAESGYVFVDPDGFLCEPAYDLGVAMRGWTHEVLAAEDPIALTHGWSSRLADATGVDDQVIWEWALIERVTTGLFLTRSGHRAEGLEYLASAERLV